MICSSVNRLRFIAGPPRGHPSRADSHVAWSSFLGAGRRDQRRRRHDGVVDPVLGPRLGVQPPERMLGPPRSRRLGPGGFSRSPEPPARRLRREIEPARPRQAATWNGPRSARRRTSRPQSNSRSIQGHFKVISRSIQGPCRVGTRGVLRDLSWRSIPISSEDTTGQETACRRRGPRAHDDNRPRGFGGCRGPQPLAGKQAAPVQLRNRDLRLVRCI